MIDLCSSRGPHAPLLAISLFHVLFPVTMEQKTVAQDLSVDFRYAPARYLTVIGFVDDWQKTLVSDRGALAYDFAPGPYAQPLTEISIGAVGEDLTAVRQTLTDPRVPIVTTVLANGRVGMTQQAFALVTGREGSHPSGKVGTVQRLVGLSGTGAWASPPTGTDPAFRSVAWGTNRPIIYEIAVPRGGRKKVALGFCEPYKSRPRMRLLELRIEGAKPITVDPLKDSVQNRPYLYTFNSADINRDGRLRLEVHASPQSPDPNVILNCFWVFPDNAELDEESVIRGKLSMRAEVYYPCGRELELSAPFPRLDGVVASFDNQTFTPVVTVRSRKNLAFETATGILRADGRPLAVIRPAAVKVTRTSDGMQLELPRDVPSAEVIAAHGPVTDEVLLGAPSLRKAIHDAKRYWTSENRIPYGVISVPDSGVQYLLDASIRTLYQVREYADGVLQYQPGPTVYRGIWLYDLMLSGMPVMMLGDITSQRAFLEGALRHQRPDGQVRVIEPLLSLPETPLTIAALCFYARCAGDTSWLRARWDALAKGLSWICATRAKTLEDAHAPWYGLMPPGFVDGGIANETADYGSVWWTMLAIEQATEMAHSLAISPDPEWASTYSGLSARFRVTASRDMRRDEHGNSYLPIAVNDTTSGNPTRGQYALLFPFRWGKFFLRDTVFRRAALASISMLDTWTVQGLIVNSGWLRGGVWPWLSGIHGMAHALLGDSDKARDLLYAVANHAAPTGVWVEEQHAKEVGRAVAGDVSDAEASAVFISHVRDLVMQERLDTLDIFRNLPDQWLAPGACLSIRGGGSAFGPVTLSLSVAADGRSADVRIAAIHGRGSTGRPIVYLAGLHRAGFHLDGESRGAERIVAEWGIPLSLRLKR